MKRTLFNTMMGCLAALSLAGCGGSGSSSSGPSESLISEGFNVVFFGEYPDGNSQPGYTLALHANQTCDLVLKYDVPLHTVTGTWSAKSLGNGEFELSLSIGDTSDKGCTIRGVSSVRLTIDNMEKYRNGEDTGATLSEVPFTHEGPDTCGYDDTNFKGIGMSFQYKYNYADVKL